MTSNEMRSVRDALRHQHGAALDEIEDAITSALDRIAEEAVTWGCDAQHDFSVDAAVAKVIRRIADLLEHAQTIALRAVAMNAGADR